MNILFILYASCFKPLALKLIIKLKKNNKVDFRVLAQHEPSLKENLV